MNLQFVKQTFKDTVYLSDFASDNHLESKQVVHELPSALSFDRCAFEGPVYAARPGERLMGTSISFSESSFAKEVDLTGTNLSHSLDMFGVVCSQSLKLEDCYIGNRLELRSAKVGGILRITECLLGDLQAARAAVQGGASLQRTTVIRGLSFMEAELFGYVDMSYLSCYGNAFFDLLKTNDRIVFDHSHFHQNLSLVKVDTSQLSERNMRVQGRRESLPLIKE
jgi:hypothetical protein